MTPGSGLRAGRKAGRGDRFGGWCSINSGEGGDPERNQDGAKACSDTSDQSCFFDHGHLPGVEQLPASCLSPCLPAPCLPAPCLPVPCLPVPCLPVPCLPCAVCGHHRTPRHPPNAHQHLRPACPTSMSDQHVRPACPTRMSDWHARLAPPAETSPVLRPTCRTTPARQRSPDRCPPPIKRLARPAWRGIV